jgi:hypothetical protein
VTARRFPPPVRKIETKGRVFLAAPRTRAVTALPESEGFAARQGLPSRAGGAVTLTKTMSLFAAFFLTALSFALLAYTTGRSGNHIIAAMLAAGAWLFGGITVLIGALIW